MNLYSRLEAELELAKTNKVYNVIKILATGQSDVVKINDQQFLNMCSNNYLGFANDPITVNAVKEGIDLFGVGPGAVRTISGSYSIHEEFEQRLAKFKKVESTIVVQSGFQANTGLIPTITTEEDLIISDELNHASIIDGIRLSKASREVYKHCDMEDLERILVKHADKVKGNIFIISDAVFSMDGDIAPLPEINRLAKKYHAYTIADDAHGEGVLGNNGEGTIAHFGLEGKIDIEVGTLSKAFGLVGGFICGKASLIEYLKQRSRVFLFSSSLPASFCYAGIKILDELEKSNHRIHALWDNTRYLQNKFIADGYSIGTTKTPITPFMVYEEAIATDLTKVLFEHNILVSPIIYPTVQKGKARIRLMISALHTKDELDQVYQIITSEYQKLKTNKEENK
ncbi:glycine C-acetyltransferase [Spiroplasma syrphidicola EA-1]|uniref:Glycine C-acetyltransferase n=1 Tax=Spiroplasma syrphidicola EA-1 TaxID=1276229 RepID=R4UDP9_9MOLU|nr:aminotransferase class I/II-fold pyridoxal phosphate-dependent enzyme [Spiroplasma syrphidicola]AGM26029.1 glycine C-acetyltransferase [Spiroplasma syrphidicola EA-1]